MCLCASVLVDPGGIRKVLVTRSSEGVQDDANHAIASAVALDHCQKILDGELKHSLALVPTCQISPSC